MVEQERELEPDDLIGDPDRHGALPLESRCRPAAPSGYCGSGVCRGRGWPRWSGRTSGGVRARAPAGALRSWRPTGAVGLWLLTMLMLRWTGERLGTGTGSRSGADQKGPLLNPVRKSGCLQQRALSVYDLCLKLVREVAILQASPRDYRRTWLGELLEVTDLSTAQQLAGHAWP